MIDKFRKEREKYHNVCQEIAEFVDLPQDSLIYPDMKFDKKAIIMPKFKVGTIKAKSGVEFEQRISILPWWQRALLTPLLLHKDTLRHEARHAAHYAIMDYAYEEDPTRAHWLLRKEKPLYYETILKFTLRPRKRKNLKLARALLEQVGTPKGQHRTVEKVIHFYTITKGLTESFADENNLFRNLCALGIAVSLTTLAMGIVGAISHGLPDIELVKQGKEISEASMQASKYFNYGYAGTLASIFLIPHAYYRNTRSLTPKNIERFTPKERRYLLAFPSDYKPLEQRCEELKKAGFPL